MQTNRTSLSRFEPTNEVEVSATMIMVKIGGHEKRLEDINESWVNRELHEATQAVRAVCIRVRINTSDLDMVLSTRDCPIEGGNRRPTRAEQQIFDLWEQRGLNEFQFNGGQLITFLEEAQRLL